MDHESLITTLAKKVSRLFYDPPQIIILDILLQTHLLFDTELIELLKISSKEFNRHISKLKEDKLIKCENKIENIEGRQHIKQVFFIDFCQLKDIIKYKIYKMSQQEISSAEEMLICTKCNKEFNLLDAQSLVRNYKFYCDECDGELTSKQMQSANLDAHKVMMDEIGELIGLLKEIDKFDVKNVDYFQALKSKDIVKTKAKIVEKKIEEENFEEAVYGEEIVKDEVVKERIMEKVLVEGKEKWFDEITEIDKEKMSEDEYVLYYEIYMKYN